MSNAHQFKTVLKAVRFTPEQYHEIEQRADRCGMRPAVWMRTILLRAAAEKPRKGHLRIKEPNGVSI
jgi:hypothetical protein